MKNSIIFYVLLIALVFGGVKWTAHSLFLKKKAVLEKTNFSKELQGILAASGDAQVAVKLANKDIVLYNFNSDCEHCLKEMPQLNKLVTDHPNTQVLGVSSDDKDQLMAVLSTKKIAVNFPIVQDKADWMTALGLPIAGVYGKGDDPKSPKGRRPEVIVLDAAGKVKLYSVGEKKDLFKEIEKQLN